MRYLISFFAPWFVFFTMGKIIQGILCFILQCTIIGWLPAVIWSIVSVNDYNRKKDTNRIVDAIKSANTGSQDSAK